MFAMLERWRGPSHDGGPPTMVVVAMLSLLSSRDCHGLGVGLRSSAFAASKCMFVNPDRRNQVLRSRTGD